MCGCQPTHIVFVGFLYFFILPTFPPFFVMHFSQPLYKLQHWNFTYLKTHSWNCAPGLDLLVCSKLLKLWAKKGKKKSYSAIGWKNNCSCISQSHCINWQYTCCLVTLLLLFSRLYLMTHDWWCHKNTVIQCKRHDLTSLRSLATLLNPLKWSDTQCSIQFWWNHRSVVDRCQISKYM